MMLVVDNLKYIEESEQHSLSQALRLVVFRGSTVAPFTTSLSLFSAGNPWDDFETGEVFHADVNATLTSAADVYVVVAVEVDDGRDVTEADAVGDWRAQADQIWKSIMMGFIASGQLPSCDAAREAGFQAIRNALYKLASSYMSSPHENEC